MAEVKNTDPILFGGIVGFCIGFVVMFMLSILIMVVESRIQKKDRKMLNATDLLGEEVVYEYNSLRVEGQVVSVDFDLEESGLETTVYIDVDFQEAYFKVDYRKNFKKIRLKGADDEQREAG